MMAVGWALFWVQVDVPIKVTMPILSETGKTQQIVLLTVIASIQVVVLPEGDTVLLVSMSPRVDHKNKLSPLMANQK